ncbi:MAG TPA: hypothetical protein VNO79_12315 [Actinomycetota bacterium]|nr:hypothetical protein [Actinomycetota bacterium]
MVFNCAACGYISTHPDRGPAGSEIRCPNCAAALGSYGPGLARVAGGLERAGRTLEAFGKGVMAMVLWVALALLFGVCAWAVWTDRGGISASVSARNVLGSYTVYVSNGTDERARLSCTVRALHGGRVVGSDRFSLSLGPGESAQRSGKLGLSEPTDDLEVDCR